MEAVEQAVTNLAMSEVSESSSSLKHKIAHGTLHALRTKHRGILATDLSKQERNEKVMNAFRASLEKTQRQESTQMSSAYSVTCDDELRTIQDTIIRLPGEIEASLKEYALEFCNKIANRSKKATSPHEAEASHIAAKEILGKLTVLARINPQVTLSLIDKSKTATAVNQIKDAFRDQINALKSQLEVDAQAITKQQSPDPIMFKSFELPKIIAKLLIADDGTLNLSIKDEVMSLLFGSTIESYEDEIKRTLDAFQKNPVLMEIYKSIQKPPSPDMKANMLIRDTMGISGTSSVTDVDAKRAFLACMMSKARQGNIGDCFAVSVLIEIKALRPELIARDIRDLFMKDYLERTIDKQKKPIEYILDANDDSLTTKIAVKINGDVSRDGATIWQSIALKAACTSMGIKPEDSEAAIKMAFEKIAKASPSKSTVKVTANQLIEIISKGFKDPSIQNAKKDLGTLGFVAKISNPVLRALEYTFAAMAEARPNFVRAHVLSCVTTALGAAFKTSFFTDSKTIKKIKDVFVSTLNNITKIIYDPNTTEGSDSAISGDGHSNNDGAFVIKGVENPDQFVEHVKKAIDATNITLSGQLTATRDQRLLQRTIDKIKSLVEQKTFLIQAIRNFDSDNAKDPDPVENWQSLATPWRAQYGNDPYEVERVYFEKDDLDIRTFTPHNATNLFIWLLDIAKEFQAKTKYLDNDIPSERLELCSPQHAFNFILENQVFATLVRDERSSKEIVDEYIKTHCEELEKTTLGHKKHKSILDWVKKKFIPDENSEEFDLTIKVHEKQTLNDLKDTLRDFLVKVHGDNAKTVKKIDSALHVGLTKKFHESKGTNLDAIIPFADTNWNEEDNSIFFCIYPTATGPQMGMIFQDGTNLRPMDQNEWLGGEWEVSETEVTMLAN